jgi:uncharacterized protein YjiS (DUF1127 family)
MRQRTDTEGWARHAGASNGFADMGLSTHLVGSLFQSSGLHYETRTRRPAGPIVGAARAMLAWLRAFNARRRQRSEAHAVYESLRVLDDRTLHDIGFTRSELGSVASEASGLAERTRANTLHTTYGLPG